MKMRNIAFVILAVVALALPAAAADTFAIDAAHTEIGFSVTHMVISKVKGKFTGFEGTITYDKDDISKSSVQVEIQSTSIDTNNEKRDNHLRSSDFFAADKYPTITFKSTKVAKKGAGFVAHGPLTIHGVTKDVALEFTVTGVIKDPWGGTRMGVEVKPFTIDRTEYGVSWSKSMDGGGLVVGDDVEIAINIEAVMK